MNASNKRVNALNSLHNKHKDSMRKEIGELVDILMHASMSHEVEIK